MIVHDIDLSVALLKGKGWKHCVMARSLDMRRVVV